MDSQPRRTERLSYQDTVHKVLLANSSLKKELGINIYIEDAIDSFAETFKKHVPGISSENVLMELKMCTRDRVFQFGKNAIKNKHLFIPLDVFFYPYTIDPDTDTAIEVIQDDLDILIVFKTRYFGNFYFIAGGTMDGHKTTFEMNKKYHTEEAKDTHRHTISCEMPDDARHSNVNIFYLARIEPYICAHCGTHVPRMKKCEGCWTHLGMCVRYCSKDCQKNHYVHGNHRIVCGKNNEVQREIREQELNDRSEQDRVLTLESL